MNHQAVGQHPTPIHWAVELSSWVPVANVAYGLTALFIKYAYIPFASEATIDGSRFLTKIDRESGWTPVFVLIPFLGRLGVFLYDRHSKSATLENIFWHEISLFQLSPWLRNDRDVVLAGITEHPLDLRYADRLLRNDREIVLSAVRGDSRAFAFASEALQNDLNVQLTALIGSPELLTRCAEQRAPGTANYNPADNQAFFTTALGSNRAIYNYFPAWLPRDSRALVLALIEINPEEFNRASEALRNDQEVQIAAIRGKAALLTNITLLHNPGTNESIDFFYRAVQANGLALQHLPEWLFEPKREGVLKNLTFNAICQNRLAFRYLPACLNQEKHAKYLLGIMRAAVMAPSASSSQAFRYLPQCLSGDQYAREVKELTIDAVSDDPEMLKYAFQREQNDLDVVFSARRYDPNGMDLALPFASERIRFLHQNAGRLTDEAMLDAIAEDPSVLKYYGDAERHQNNKDFMLKAIARNPRAFLYASDGLKNDNLVALAAVEGDGLLFSEVGHSLGDSVYHAQAAYRNNPQVLKNLRSRPMSWLQFTFVPYSFFDADALLEAMWRKFAEYPLPFDADVLIKDVADNPSALLHYAPLRKDRYFMLQAIGKNAKAFEYADEELQNDPDFVRQAVSIRIHVIDYISSAMMMRCFPNSTGTICLGEVPDLTTFYIDDLF